MKGESTDYSNVLFILKYFRFTVCDGLGYLKEVFKFPLTMEEEEVFISYLDKSGNRDAGDLKVMYLLSRARYQTSVSFLKYIL